MTLPAARLEFLPFTSTPTLDFAVEELSRFLALPGVLAQASAERTVLPGLASGFDAPNWRIHFNLEAGLEPFAFGVKVNCQGQQIEVQLLGANPPAILHAAYSLLEHLGYHFSLSGPLAPDHLALDRLKDWELLVRPAVQLRGIRQHINFPMDISSYPLDEAREYIRNLARMRFNWITFHSYPNQWIRGPQWGENELAGEFFYGQRHDIPPLPMFRQHIRNLSIFCIPEIEPYFDEPEERSQRAVAWLQSVMVEANRVGLGIQFSFEPRLQVADTTRTLETCRTILATYPLIDRLELMTQETGGWGEAVSQGRIREVTGQLFGEQALALAEVQNLLEQNQPAPDLLQLLGELGHNLRASRDYLQDQQSSKVPLSLGIYCVVPRYLAACMSLLRAYTPEPVDFTLLPGHSSQRVARFLPEARLLPADWNRLLLYSWIEFDGNMYLQQNGIPGIREALQQGLATINPAWTAGIQEQPLHGLCFNHWRTAENRVTARYASLGSLFGPVDEKDFYPGYAHELGIGLPLVFNQAMWECSEADAQSTEDLPNVGFCYAGCWTAGRDPVLGYFSNWEVEKLRFVAQRFSTVRELLVTCLAETASGVGRQALGFLINRLECTLLYLKAMETGSQLQDLKSHVLPSGKVGLDAAEQEQAMTICRQALDFLEQTIQHHARAMPDRGCEGTLISLYHTPVAVLETLLETFRNQTSPPGEDQSGDAPPSPIQFTRT